MKCILIFSLIFPLSLILGKSTADNVKANQPSCLAAPKNSSRKDYRLPTTVIPTFYKLKIIPILHSNISLPNHEQFSAPGTIIITVECQTATNSITFHAKKDIKIKEDSIKVSKLVHLCN